MNTTTIPNEKIVRHQQFSLIRGERSDAQMFRDLFEIVENAILLYDILAIVPSFSRQPIDHLERTDILTFTVVYRTYP
jgi:hypothetical protein